MSKSLILSEKPSQAQDIAKGLDDRFQRKDGYLEGNKYVVTWAFGHLVELEDPDAYNARYKKWKMEDLPIIPDTFKYRITKDGSKQFKVIKGLIQNSNIEKVIISTDPGREGELIARLILMMAGNKKPLYRFWSSKALTSDVVKEVFKNLKPASEYDRLYQSALSRQQADWIVGISATRAFTLKAGGYGNTYSLGRVQTPVLAILVNREMEIKSFKPQDYWLLKAKFRHKEGEYEGLWVNSVKNDEIKGGHDGDGAGDRDLVSRILREDFVKEIQIRISGKSGIIELCEQQVKEEHPPLLFSLTVLQQEANKSFGFSADKTLKIAQSLYENHKAVSYPRTESQHLNEEMAQEIPKILNNLTRYNHVKFDLSKCLISEKNKRIFNSEKLTDHHALIPTGKISEGLNPDEAKLYELIVRRLIASFYPAFKFKTTTVITGVEQDKFKTMGRTVISQGWREIYGSREERDQLLPALIEKDTVHVIETNADKKQTTPPARYTDASILSAMTNAQRFVKDEKLKKVLKETAGLGTPATRASIIETLISRGYIERKGKALIPTQKGISLINAVRNEKIADPAYTALWEQELDAIAKGEIKSSNTFMQEIKNYTKELVEKAKGISL